MVMLDVDAPENGKPHAGLQIPILNLTPELAHMRAGGVYWICVSSTEDAMALGKRMLVTASAQAKAAVVGEEDLSNLLDAVPIDLGPADTRFYQFEGRTWNALGRLAADLEKTLKPRHRTIVVLLSATGLRQRPLEELIEGWRAWLQRNGCAMVILSHGSESLLLARQLEPMNDTLSGLAVLDADQESQCSYRIVHWRNGMGIKTGLMLALTRQAQAFQVDDAMQWQHPAKGLDEDRVFLDERILEGSAFILPADWRVCAGWNELRICGMAASDATLVFALNTRLDLTDLALILHELRRRRGRRMKLVVRVLQRSLRHQDEQMLLDCGATIVVPSDVKAPGLMSLLEAVQGQVYARTLVADVEQLAARQHRQPHASGELSTEEFLGQLEDLLAQQDTSGSPGVLIQLAPAQGLSARQALTQLRVRRSGDIACHAGNMVHLFLASCRPEWANIALGRVFRLPVAELFAEYRVHDTKKEIAWQVDALKQQISQGNNPIQEAPADAQASARHDGQVPAAPQAGEASRPRPMPLRLEGSAA